MTTPRQVQAALTREAAKLKKGRLGVLTFSPVFPCDDDPDCNWSSRPSINGGPTQLSEMRELLWKVQARYPVVEWPRRS